MTKTRKVCILLGMFLMLWTGASAQNRNISGTVTDSSDGSPLIGATVQSGSNYTITDMDGHFTISVPENVSEVSFSYIGYTPVTLPVKEVMNVTMSVDSQVLSDVVVIGYGTVRKSDLTGSVSTVRSEDFNKGALSSPEQLISGKIAGVQITSSGGATTDGSTIRIRGGASLNASNDPLIVVDGVPLESGGIAGSGNFFAMINPNDIESMTVLKDASSTAIYGSRASNGVIIITTKKSQGGKMHFSFTSTNDVQIHGRLAQMLSRDEFISTISSAGTAAQQSLLGTESTNWNSQVYRAGFGTDNNLSLSGKAGFLPYRASIGYYRQNGIVRGDATDRLTAALTLNPTFLQGRLAFNFNAKGSLNDNSFYNSSAIWAAATFNPTLPVYSDDAVYQTYGGYWEALDASGLPVNGGVRNPRGLVNQYESTSKVQRLILSGDVDYKFSFLPELKLHATLGTDLAKGKGSVYVPLCAASNYTSYGLDYDYGPQKKVNRLLTLYANYNKYFEEAKSNLDVTVGYDYQYWKSSSPMTVYYNALGEQTGTASEYDSRHTLISYYGRVNYSYDGKYLLTATMRRDGTSRFSPSNRWGTFPSVALGWVLSRESWMSGVTDVLNNFKLRASYGVTGQQDGIGDYGYLPIYSLSVDGQQALMNGSYIYTYNPANYVENLKWETTTSWDLGFDWGLFDDRISGGFDVYFRKTKDLIATVPAPAGSAFDKYTTTNVGNVNSRGIEFTLNATPVKKKDFQWDLSYNFTWQKMKVTNLSVNHSDTMTNMLSGSSVGGYQFEVLTEGYAPYMFYLYHQAYNENGTPIEGVYADLNGDGVINSDDRYRCHNPAPDFIMGLSSNIRWRKWTMGMNFRANIGNYVFNGLAMNMGAWETVSYNSFQLNNLNRSYLDTRFSYRQYLSDYYLENASFLKMDNLSVAYSFGRVADLFDLSVSGMVQNVFCITKYSGVDPEVSGGVESTTYPRPRVFTLSLGINF